MKQHYTAGFYSLPSLAGRVWAKRKRKNRMSGNRSLCRFAASAN
jgi:hypothetical protein